MTRLIGPDAGSRATEAEPGRWMYVYTDKACTVLADILAYVDATPASPGAAVPGSRLTLDADGLVPLFWFPDGARVVWGKLSRGGPVFRLVADVDARLDSVNSALAHDSSVLATQQGAVGDYSGRYGSSGAGTDDRVAIQAALNAASDVNDSSYYGYLTRRSTTVRLPPGDYLISAPASGASLVVPPGVLFDYSDATLYFDYPAAPTTAWCGIQVGQYGQLHVGKTYVSGRNSAPDGALAYDAIRLVMTDNNSRVIGYGDSEIRGFQGAGIRLVGAWISYIKGIRFTGLKYGIVASNRGDGTLGYALPVGNPSGSRRVVTDLRIEDCHLVNISNGGFRGTVSGNAADINAIDYSDSGLTVSFIGCVVESIGTYGVYVANATTVTMIDCGFEEVGASDGMVWLDSVRTATMIETRVNLAGRTVPGPSGNVQPFPSDIIKVNSLQTLDVTGMYVHNTLNANLRFAQAAPTVAYRLAGVYTDANALSSSSAMWAGQGSTAMSGAWNKGHLVLGGYHLWVDGSGRLRISAAAPASDTDGSVVGAQS